MMITEIEDYFTKGCGRCARFATPDCSTRLWITGLNGLRDLCRAAGLEEVVKWGHPVYMAGGRNLAIFGAFREDFRITFFNAALMRDPEGVLRRQGPNSAHADAIRFTDSAQVAAKAPVIAAYLAEARGYAEAGVLPPRVVRDLELPEELIEAMDGDPELAEAYHRLTPGRQKSYVLALTSTRVPATRLARIERYRPAILAGRGALDRD